MRVGIAGAGAIALGYAAFLSKQGHDACVWSPSGRGTSAFVDGIPLRISGCFEEAFPLLVCADVQDLCKNDVVILALPAYGHRTVIDRIAPYLEASHTVIISGHLSFSALYLSKKLAERGIEIPIAVWNTTVLTAKMQSPAEVRIGAIRKRVDMATLPVRLSQSAFVTCCELFGERFDTKDDLLTIALSNLNPENHMGIALCNLTRIERAETWGQNQNITPAVGRLLEALDTERLEIAVAYGKSVRTIYDHFSLSFGVAGASMHEIADALVQKGNDPMGPRDIQTRYVLEDVPFGLVATLYLAQICGVAAPLHQSGVEILSAAYGRDLAKDNDILPEIRVPNVKLLRSLVVDGYYPSGAV